MSVKKIKENNNNDFLLDIKRVRDVMSYSSLTKCFFKIRKMDVLHQAETNKIRYYMTDQIFKVRRIVMVIL